MTLYLTFYKHNFFDFHNQLYKVIFNELSSNEHLTVEVSYNIFLLVIGKIKIFF